MCFGKEKRIEKIYGQAIWRNQPDLARRHPVCCRSGGFNHCFSGSSDLSGHVLCADGRDLGGMGLFRCHYHRERQKPPRLSAENLCIFPDQSAADLSVPGPVYLAGLGNLSVL